MIDHCSDFFSNLPLRMEEAEEQAYQQKAFLESYLLEWKTKEEKEGRKEALTLSSRFFGSQKCSSKTAAAQTREEEEKMMNRV